MTLPNPPCSFSASDGLLQLVFPFSSSFTFSIVYSYLFSYCVSPNPIIWRNCGIIGLLICVSGAYICWNISQCLWKFLLYARGYFCQNWLWSPLTVQPPGETLGLLLPFTPVTRHTCDVTFVCFFF